MSAGGTRPCRSVSGASPGRQGSCGTAWRGPKRTSADAACLLVPEDAMTTGGAACSRPASSRNENGATLACRGTPVLSWALAVAAGASAATTHAPRTTFPRTGGKIVHGASGRAACFDEPVGRDEMGDRHVEARLRLLDQAALEPVRRARRVGHDHDLLGREGRQGIGDREHGAGVADLA